MILKTLRHALFLFLANVFALGVAQASPQQVDSQEELARVADVFRPSRYLVYADRDPLFYFFREQGKFGPLGPHGEFKVPREVITIQTPPAGQVFVYEQNENRFRLGHPSKAELIPASFKARTTREQEQYEEALARLQEPQAQASMSRRIEALYAVVRTAFRAGHHNDVVRYGQEALRLWEDAGLLSRFIGDVGRELHAIHIHMGLVALQRGDVAGASGHLKASGRGPTAATLKTFGPNMGLAAALLAAGQRQVVQEYLSDCATFWYRRELLTRWQQDIAEGRVPDFRGYESTGL
ncbi:hypothetical protein [Hydrogenophaga sp.]|uniref:hypothetical protein n=1 Tax=Hydrogenophaga sp. TaxID=1904254 RepID=UPI00261F9D32|nr:hypothetical protein [Hydrogenophaga sp.]MCW5653675.1 hypothetical protein [Hydrogenophaga sp.]